MINSKLALLALSIIFLSLSGCMQYLYSEVAKTDAMWRKDNQLIYKELGKRRYNLSKEDALNAIAVAFANLNITIDNISVPAGVITGRGNSPTPLTLEEFKAATKVEKQRINSMFVFITVGFVHVFSVAILRADDQVEITISAKLEYVGDRTMLVPETEMAPKVLELSYKKIWEEFEKVAFIHNKTLQ